MSRGSEVREVRADLRAPEAGDAAARPSQAALEMPPSIEHALAELAAERAERARLERILALRTCALDAASTHFMITDRRRRGWPIVYVNRALARDHGYRPEELLGQSASLLVPADLNPVQLEALNAALRRGDSYRTELRARRKDESTFWCGVTLEPVRDAAGCVTHYVSIGADITAKLADAEEKRRLQDQLLSEMRERERMAIDLRFAQKLEAVGRLAAGIAHEINTPIQYIGDSVAFVQSGLAELQRLVAGYRACAAPGADDTAARRLEEIERLETETEWPFLSAEMPRAIERALEGVSRAANIVRAMREFAHPDGSEQSGADLNHALETTLTVARNEYKYVASVETELGDIPQVICNVGELNQVFLNLIVNAAHAIESAGLDASSGRIRIATARADASVEITIADNGCGIAEESLEKIFDPFFTTKAVGKGTGQGLAIARSIVVEKHQGSIEVSSRPGAGTRFRITLPIGGRGSGS